MSKIVNTLKMKEEITRNYFFKNEKNHHSAFKLVYRERGNCDGKFACI